MVASPAKTLRVHLAEQRSAGAPFAAAWPRALQVALSEADEREEWSAVLVETLEAWRAAFERRPASRPERALAVVGGDPERTVPLIGDRICEYCEEAIAASKQSNAVYCSRECQRAANGRAVAA
ncbi:MAG: hypothetical protein ACR2K6_04510 [Solirubrobacterales bacterium]